MLFGLGTPTLAGWEIRDAHQHLTINLGFGEMPCDQLRSYSTGLAPPQSRASRLVKYGSLISTTFIFWRKAFSDSCCRTLSSMPSI